MTTVTADTARTSIAHRACPGAPILHAPDPTTIDIRAGTTVTIEENTWVFDDVTAIHPLSPLVAGHNYAVGIDTDGAPFAIDVTKGELDDRYFGGFHFAPGSNAPARAGGDTIPAINPSSIWDIGFRPACPDPRGMTRVDLSAGKSVWVDIYLLGTNHAEHGTSCFGATIANGRTLDLLDYPTAVKIVEGHGKRLLTYDEFRAAAYGVTERSSADQAPKKAGLDAARTSRFGVMQATGNLWVWGTDGDVEDPRPSLFGGSWIGGRHAGSRDANLDYWPEYSGESIGARGASDHLMPA